MLVFREPNAAQPTSPVPMAAGLPLGVYATYPVGGAWVNAATGAFSGTRGSYTPLPSRAGLVWDASANSVSFDLNVPSAPLYGALFVVDITIADLTAASTAFNLLASTADNAGISGALLRTGSSTAYLTNEVIAFTDGTANRSGVSGTIPVGMHTICIQWDAPSSRYEFWVDGVLPPQLHTATPIGLQTLGRYFIGRVFSSQARIRPSLIVINQSPGFDLRGVQTTPWRLLSPRRVWVPVTAAAGNPALTGNSVTASVGTLTPSESLGTTGNQATGSQGTVAPTLSLATTGNAATSNTGTPVAELSIGLAGQGATASAGVVSVAGSGAVALSGNAATASAGTLTPSEALGTTGNAATASSGTAAPVLSLGVSGQAVTSATGTPVASLTVGLLGNASTAAVGSVGAPTGDITLALTGNSAAASAGTLGVDEAQLKRGGDDAPRRGRFQVQVRNKLYVFDTDDEAVAFMRSLPKKAKKVAKAVAPSKPLEPAYVQMMSAITDGFDEEQDIEDLLMLL